MIAPNRPTSLRLLSTQKIRFVALIASAAMVLSSTSFASSIGQRLFASAAAIVSGGQTSDTHAHTASPAFAAAAVENATMSVERRGHTATRLADGRVLIAGGDNSSGALNQTELYDPAAATFSAAANMSTARADHSATLLADGRVLIAGGRNGGASTDSTEIFDPATGAFTSGPSMSTARAGHSATLLANGRVLIAGGDSDGTAEVFDAAAGTFVAAGSLGVARSMHSAALLQDGRVLLVGGRDASGNELTSGEIFDTPASAFWTVDNALKVARVRAHLRVLFDGKVQIIGGNNDGSMEIYDPVFEGFGAYAHVLPESDPCVGLSGQILNSQTRAALFHNGQADALLDRSGHTITELNGQALVLGGVNSGGAVLSSSAVLGSSSASITTDKMDYAPGEIAAISGRGFQPGEVVRVKIHEDPHTPQERGFNVTADAEGNFSGEYLVMDYDLNMKFIIGARGLSSGRTSQTTFTDARLNTLTVGAQSPNPVTPGNSASYTVTVGFNGNGDPCTVTLAAIGLPAGASGSFSPNPVTGSGVVNLGSTLTVSTTLATPGGSHLFTVRGTTGSNCQGGGPAVINAPATLVVAADAETTTTVNNANATYGDTSVNLSATVSSTSTVNVGTVTFTVKQGLTTIGVPTTSGTVSGGNASVSYALPAGTDAGPYTIEASYTPGTGFNASSGTGTLTINKRAIEVTADAGQFKIYGDADPTFTYTITSGSLVPPDAFTGALSRVAGDDVGLYAITIGTLAINDGNGGNNYNLTFVSKNFEIKKRAIQVTADPGQFKIYGDADPTFTYTITSGSLVPPDAFIGALSRMGGEDAGLYAITLGSLAIDDGNGGNNYNLTFVSNNFEIKKRAIEVTADAGQFKIYGDADPAAFTYSITGGSLAFTDTFTGALSRMGGEDAGLYAITIGTLAIDDGNGGNNYNLTFVSNNFEIKKRPATWTTSAASKTYGDPDPVPLTTGSGSDFLVADGVTATYSRAVGENASGPTYHITATLSAIPMSALNNYVITNNGNEFTINKRPLQVTATAGQFKIYGDPDPTFAYTITSGTLAFMDMFTGALSRDPGQNVGFYPITIGTLTVNDGNGGFNYNLTLVGNNFEIKKRPITIKADPKTKTFGDPDPVFTYQITSGSLAFSDTFTGALSRAPGELVGVYPINIGTLAINDGNGGNNYTLTFVPDNLTILTACSVFNGFLSPIGGSIETGNGGTFSDPVRAFKLNSTIPVKFNAICFGVPLTTGVHTLQAIKMSNATDGDSPIDATPTDAATTGNQFRLTGTEWHFNMNTKALGVNSQGTYLLKATLFDGSIHTVWVSIKK